MSGTSSNTPMYSAGSTSKRETSEQLSKSESTRSNEETPKPRPADIVATNIREAFKTGSMPTLQESTKSQRSTSAKYVRTAPQSSVLHQLKPTNGPKDQEFDNSLNVFHEDFDHLKALSSLNFEVPAVDAPTLDSIENCRYLLRQSDKNFASRPEKRHKPHKEIHEIEDRKSDDAIQQILQFTAEFRVPVSTVENNSEGPLQLLKEFFQAKAKVKVYIRGVTNTVGLRGYLEGYIKAFDHHMNLVLQDVDETFVRRAAVDRSTKQEKEKVHEPRLEKHGKKPEAMVAFDKTIPILMKQKRYMKMLFVRGENIVSVCQIID